MENFDKSKTPQYIEELTQENTQQISVDTPSNANKRQTISLIIVGIVLLLLSGVVLVYVTFSNIGNYTQTSKKPAQQAVKSQETKEVSLMAIDATAPSDWEKIDTNLGFSIKKPSGWSDNGGFTSTIAGLREKEVILYENPTPGGGIPTSISVKLSQHEKHPDKAGYEQYMSTLNDDYKAVYKQFGYNISDIKVRSKHILLNGNEWLEVDRTLPNQFGRELYSWQDSYAIVVSTMNKDEKAAQPFIDKYLYKVASSVSTKDKEKSLDILKKIK